MSEGATRSSSRRRKRNASSPASPAKRMRRSSRRSQKKKQLCRGPCQIMGKCDGSETELVKFDACACRGMCLKCARHWLKQSSSCPFCRKEVSLINGVCDVAPQAQRIDHDVMVPSFAFPYVDFLGEMEIFHASVQTSVLFANSRATYKLPKQFLFLINACEEDEIEMVLNDTAYYSFCSNILSPYRGRRQQVLYRILFYFSLEKQSGVAFFFLMTLLRKQLSTRRPVDITDNHDLLISKAIFKDIPEKCFFENSCLQIYRNNEGTRHYYLLQRPLKMLYPQLRIEEEAVTLFDGISSEEEEEIDFFTTEAEEAEEAADEAAAAEVAIALVETREENSDNNATTTPTPLRTTTI